MTPRKTGDRMSSIVALAGRRIDASRSVEHFLGTHHASLGRLARRVFAEGVTHLGMWMEKVANTAVNMAINTLASGSPSSFRKAAATKRTPTTPRMIGCLVDSLVRAVSCSA